MPPTHEAKLNDVVLKKKKIIVQGKKRGRNPTPVGGVLLEDSSFEDRCIRPSVSEKGPGSGGSGCLGAR